MESIEDRVAEELQHIRRGLPHSEQEELRTEYAAFRTLHLGDSEILPASAALIQAVFNIRRHSPAFEPEYDLAFFFGAGVGRDVLDGYTYRQELEALGKVIQLRPRRGKGRPTR
jgi:hypothetical protein